MIGLPRKTPRAREVVQAGLEINTAWLSGEPARLAGPPGAG